MAYSLEATYYRTALLLGILPGSQVHRWAERIIERAPTPPEGFLDVISAGPNDLSALRAALWPLAVEPEPPSVLRAMFALLHADLESGRRSLSDTITVLRQMRSMLRLPSTLYAELNAVLVEQVSIHTSVPRWLALFSDEHLALLGRA
jgi:hypothetical protein